MQLVVITNKGGAVGDAQTLAAVTKRIERVDTKN